jgi:hypothetical protein
MPTKRSIKELWEELEELGKEAEEIALQTKLLLPNYVYQILLRLCFLPMLTSEPFKYQFQPWFDPEAHQAQWHCVERVTGYVTSME